MLTKNTQSMSSSVLSKGLFGYLIHARRQQLDKGEVFARVLQRVSCGPVVKRALHLHGMSTIGPYSSNSAFTAVQNWHIDSGCCMIVSMLLPYACFRIERPSRLLPDYSAVLKSVGT